MANRVARLFMTLTLRMVFRAIPQSFIDLKKRILDRTRTPQKTLLLLATLSHRFYGILQIFAIGQIAVNFA
jgi:hypothetical protein